MKSPETKKSSMKGFSTNILHIDFENGTEHGAIHEAIQPSVTFAYPTVNQLINVFQGKSRGYAYSRNSSPTITALENKITMMEQGKSSLLFSTGLAAVSATFLSLLKKGDHLVVSQYLFGNSFSFFKTLIHLGFEVDFVDVTRVEEVKKVIKENTKFFFTETIANPSTQVPDLYNISKLLTRYKKKKIISIIDNTMTTPYLYLPQKHGFSFSINSLTKYISGHGSSLGGSLTDLGNFEGFKDENIFPIYKKKAKNDCLMLQVRKKGMRDMGGTLSPYAAHLVSLGSETLALRMEKQIENSKKIAETLVKHPKIEKVYYPGLSNHPQHGLSKKYYKGHGALISFILKDKKKISKKLTDSQSKIYQFMNALKVILRSSHLGDNRTLAIPVAKTIFYEMGKKQRDQIGIEENQIRLSVGIEEVDDILGDILQALKAV